MKIPIRVSRIRTPSPRARRIGWWLAIATALVAAVLVLTDPFADTSSPPAKVVAADLSGRPTACLATDTSTAGRGTEVRDLWAVMQSAAAHRSINVQQLVMPASSTKQARPYLAGLLNQHCQLIVTIGTPFGEAVRALAGANAQSRFDVVQSPAGSTADNITFLTQASAMTEIGSEVRHLQHN